MPDPNKKKRKKPVSQKRKGFSSRGMKKAPTYGKPGKKGQKSTRKAASAVRGFGGNKPTTHKKIYKVAKPYMLEDGGKIVKTSTNKTKHRGSTSYGRHEGY